MNDQGRASGLPLGLAGMMFLQYAALGAWLVTLSSWLVQPAADGGLGFTSRQTAFVYATQAIGGLVAPFITGLLADRFFASEKLLGILQLFMAAAMASLGHLANAYAGPNADPPTACLYLFAGFLAYSVASVLAVTVGNSMALRTLRNPQRSFGRVRLMGTFGWIVASNVVEWCFVVQSADLFAVAAACHLALGLTAWWLPHTPPKGRGRPVAEVMGLPAVKLFRDPSFIVFAAVAFVIQAMQQFYTVFATPFVKDRGMTWPVTRMSVAQFVEMGCMAGIAVMVSRFGLKATMVVGLSAWVLRNALLTMGDLTAITVVAIPMHGVSYTFFSIVAALYIDREAPPHLRAGAQSLLTFVAGGPGTLCGFFLCGWVKDAYTHAGTTDWPSVWIVPTVGCSIAAVIFVVLFREPRVPQPAAGPPTPELLPENP